MPLCALPGDFFSSLLPAIRQRLSGSFDRHSLSRIRINDDAPILILQHSPQFTDIRTSRARSTVNTIRIPQTIVAAPRSPKLFRYGQRRSTLPAPRLLVQYVFLQLFIDLALPIYNDSITMGLLLLRNLDERDGSSSHRIVWCQDPQVPNVLSAVTEPTRCATDGSDSHRGDQRHSAGLAQVGIVDGLPLLAEVPPVRRVGKGRTQSHFLSNKRSGSLNLC